MTTDTKLAELPDAWRATSKAAGSTPVAATLNVCAAELESALSQQSPSYDALNIIALSVAAALERAGVTECDDPGEAIDVLVQGYERTIARLSDALNAESGPTFMGEMVLPQQQPSAAGVPKGYVLVPAALAERVQDSLGRFTSDEGFAQADVDTSDDFGACVAALQPVGQEPVAWRYLNEKSKSWNTTTSEVVAGLMRDSGRGVEPLYTAPPAQAVDLGQFREAVRYSSRALPHKDLAEKMTELLALIDQQAGKGVDRA